MVDTNKCVSVVSIAQYLSQCLTTIGLKGRVAWNMFSVDHAWTVLLRPTLYCVYTRMMAKADGVTEVVASIQPKVKTLWSSLESCRLVHTTQLVIWISQTPRVGSSYKIFNLLETWWALYLAVPYSHRYVQVVAIVVTCPFQPIRIDSISSDPDKPAIVILFFLEVVVSTKHLVSLAST